MKSGASFGLALGILTTSLHCGILLAAESAETHLEKGLFQEEGNHDLEAAKKHYQSVLDEYAKNRGLAAVALFHLAQCLRKEGRTNEAVRQYDRLVQEFADQTNLVNSARSAFGQMTEFASVTTTNPPNGLNNDVRKTLGRRRAMEKQAEEKAEIERLDKFLKESPDLINVPTARGLTRLQEAASAGELQVVDFLLSRGANVHLNPRPYGKDVYGKDAKTPLEFAIGRGDAPMVTLLLKAGADLNENGPGFPLGVAVDSGNKSIVTLLLSKGANPNTSNCPLYRAASLGFRAIAEVLIEAKSDVNANCGPSSQTPLHAASEKGNIAVAELLLSKGASLAARDQDGLTPLLLACKVQQSGMAEFLLSKGADLEAVDKQGNGALHLLLKAKPSNLEFLQFLIKRKAPVSAPNHDGYSPLWLAVTWQNGKAIEMLVQAGSDPSERFSGKPEKIGGRPYRGAAIASQDITPVSYAIEMNDYELTKTLLEQGADPNPKGLNPLESAATRGLLKFVKLLVEHHVNVNQQSPLDRTTLDMVQEKIAEATSQQQQGSYFAVDGYGQRKPSLDALQEIAAYLKAHGAIENLPRLNSISIVQPGGVLQTVFLKGTNDYNHYTLLEAIVQADNVENADLLRFADLSKVEIVSHKSGDTAQKTINLLENLTDLNCNADVLLQWGDVVTVPRSDQTTLKQEKDFLEGLASCLKREIQIQVGRSVRKVLIEPRVNPAHTQRRKPGFRGAMSWGVDQFNPHLRAVISAYNFSPAELRHIRITRKLPGETAPTSFDLDLSDSQSPAGDFWLRDGDLIQINPNKE